MESTPSLFNPFPGLRSFETRDKFLFFGREEQTAELVNRLRASRFLAVVGTSGSGKSSLVRAGLIPGLHGGYMAAAGPNWKIAVMRPGGDPVGHLAEALLGVDTMVDTPDPVAFVRATLARSARGLVEWVQQSRLPAGYNLLVVVDQFEEVFRFRSRFRTLEEEAGGFVRLLLEATAQSERPIYVALTMRSDFLGDCTEFPGLAQAINEGEYLVPRLRRDQCRLAIEGPVLVGGARIAGRLVQRLLNDLGTDPDQLPVLQHALRRTWDHWVTHRSGDEPLDLAHYEAVGTLSDALSRHANEVYDALADDRQRALARGLFQALTELGPDNRGIRRPTRLRTLAKILAVEPAELVPVIDAFRQPGRTFLTPPWPSADDDASDPMGGPPAPSAGRLAAPSVALGLDTVIDISHESLMRLWKPLQTWVREEADSAAIYRRLADSARLREAGRFDRYRDPELQLALNWRRERAPNAAWGERYADGFDRALRLLDDSRAAREAERRAARRRRRLLVGAISGAALVFLALWQMADRAQRRAQSQWLAMRAIEQIGFDPRESVLLARDAVRSAPTPDAVASLRSAWWNSRLVADDPRLIQRMPGILQPLLSAANEASLQSEGRQILVAAGTNAAVLAPDPAMPPLWLKGHTNLVRVATFSPDGRTALTAGWDHQGFLWDTAQWTRRATLTGHTNKIARGGFSPDGQHVVTASADGTARIWRVTDGLEVARLAPGGLPPAEVWSVAFDHRGERVVVGTERGEVSLWDWRQTNRLWRGFHTGGRVLDLGFSPEDRAIASAGEDRRVLVWTPETAGGWQSQVQLTNHLSLVNRVAFGPGGRLLATASEDGTARLWEWLSATPLFVMRHPAPVKGVAWDARGESLLTVDGEGRVRRWLAGVRELPGTNDWSRVRWAVFSPDGSQLVLGDGSPAPPVIRTADGGRLAALEAPGNSREITHAAFHPRTNLLVTVGRDRKLLAWDTRTWRPLDGRTLTIANMTPTRVAFSPDGAWLVVVHNRHDVTLRLHVTAIDVAAWRVVADWTNDLGGRGISQAAFNADSRVLATSSDETTVRFRIPPGWRSDPPAPLRPDESFRPVNAVAFHPSDPTLLVTAGTTVRFFRGVPDAWRPLRLGGGGATNGVGFLQFVSSGLCLLSGTADGRLQLWDTATRGVIGEVPAGPGTSTPVAVLAPGGRELLVFGQLGLAFESAAWAPRDALLRETDRRWGTARRLDETDEAAGE